VAAAKVGGEDYRQLGRQQAEDRRRALRVHGEPVSRSSQRHFGVIVIIILIIELVPLLRGKG
jgi:hypothetical protein